jgi:hypothetical protein
MQVNIKLFQIIFFKFFIEKRDKLLKGMTHFNDESSGIDMIRVTLIYKVKHFIYTFELFISNNELIKFNEEMENSILDFIQNTFKDAQSINLEKVGQYLKNDNLKTVSEEENSWQAFIKARLTQQGTIYFYFPI